MLRTLLERFSRNRILKRRLPSRAGGQVLYVSPDSALAYWKHNLEEKHKDLIDWAQEFVKPGMTVWDVGANVGIFTFASAFFAGPAGKVLGMEPDTFMSSLLQRSAMVPCKSRAEIRILPVAMSNKIGIAEFAIAARGRSSNHLADVNGNEMSGGDRYHMTVLTVTMDWLIQNTPPPDVIKIDVEGAEHMVLEGGYGLISKAHPLLLCEVNSSNSDTVSGLLTTLGYEMFDLNDRSKGRIAKAVFNTLAVYEKDRM